MKENFLNRNMGSLMDRPLVIKLMILLTNLPLLLVMKKNFWIGLITFTISVIFHWYQCFSHDEGKINELCFYDVLMNLFIGSYIFFSKYTKVKPLLVYLPILYFLCAPYSFNVPQVYPYTHSLWHLLTALILFKLL